jgi:hypothetical protein
VAQYAILRRSAKRILKDRDDAGTDGTDEVAKESRLRCCSPC